MQYSASTPEEYIAQIPEERREPFQKLRSTILNNIPKGFKEEISYGMVGYVVPHTIYPAGYHCDPKLPLPFMSIASQKNFIGFYHMGIYADKELYEWFVTEYPKHCKTKLDMGKSCLRLKKIEDIPYDLIAALCKKMSVADWVTLYESNLKRK